MKSPSSDNEDNLSREELEARYEEALAELREERRTREARAGVDHDLKPKKRRYLTLPCCLATIVITALALFIIYFVYVSIREPLYRTWLQTQPKIEALPGQIESGLDTATDIYQQADEARQNLNQAADKVNDLKTGLENAISAPETK